ncbi:hypothetical protein SD71_07600 [Cohnella kolymensis]|uniref:Uncharacterized protein n=1 Tax=Cohnella kolymensis TaxID=1590652 RepID=A0ABR5A607_9BACL|nr:hypothetical protein [Cohnella kolymensis]KIL36463.1 hypothetical protein SD71_07600 [Cohnella kolymensis]
MTPRNNEPGNDGVASNPARLDQFGDKLGSENEEEFRSAAAEVCDVSEVTEDAEEEPQNF